MKILHKGKKALFLLLCGILLLTVSGMPASAKTDTGTNMISVAKKNKISRGKWIKTEQGRRYLKKNGKYVINQWCTIDGAVYCFDAAGFVKKGTFKYNKETYHAGLKGKVYVKKWYKNGKETYYYNSAGVRATGWTTIKNKKYYFTRTGELVINNWVGSKYVGKNGVQVSGKTVKGRKINKNGIIQKASQKDKYIFVGASHGVDMSVSVNSNDTIFIAKGGEGLAWLKKTAGPQLMSYLNKNPNYTVIFQLGGNDLENIKKYIKYYRGLLLEYPKTRFYFLENIPGDSKRALNYKNEAKRRYDAQLKAAFPGHIIEAYDYMEKTGFETVDGTHYTLKDIKRVYDHMIREIKAREKRGNKNR